MFAFLIPAFSLEKKTRVMGPTESILSQALGLIQSKGWGQHDLWFQDSYGGKHNFCVLGAISQFAKDAEEMYDALSRLNRALPVFSTYSTAIGYNDSPERTQKDIEKLFNKAITLARAECA